MNSNRHQKHHREYSREDVRKLRDRGWSQTNIADRLGCDQSTVSKALNGGE